jgi:hypothetical protein
LLVLTALGMTTAPPTKQPEPQLPPLHTSPVPQLVPSTARLHTDVLIVGTQLWQGLLGLGAALA